ncbi:hypothetical protein NTGBS_530030 [Candidatus Nitrotoga sp. BS]|nr:hypothetical protein NTGBS_530030 [Candidatus Nitrotoga sp. BS]
MKIGGIYRGALNVPPEQVTFAINQMNRRPKKCLDWKTPHEVFFGQPGTWAKPALNVQLRLLIQEFNSKKIRLLRQFIPVRVDEPIEQAIITFFLSIQRLQTHGKRRQTHT